ncbi:MAG: hypothetical protein CO161_02600 [Candidatus Portnoybacteria bacterium CG_4_9_14_3_um_filter_44_9]|uniref:Uncharacterized protein n=1 Tax=Candidatus Portnoybacteria bacterium CG_4_9_14_3_um_filter_44_9 TaxID=1974806 RepID=A0A2M7YJK0_9BACT|nr:MAG: hypothetical protein CO161_02600 [Candidatus Portnoybacteria bacterium CG_4_9_14_3_um_filter_44_9]
MRDLERGILRESSEDGLAVLIGAKKNERCHEESIADLTKIGKYGFMTVGKRICLLKETKYE